VDEPAGVPLDFEALLFAMPDGVAVLGPDGSVVWANAEVARLLALPLDELIGSDGIGRVHPDELARAVDGIAWAAAYPDRTAVVPYRLQRGDGSYLHAELKSTVVPTAVGDCLVLAVRDGTTRTTLAAALASVAASAPVEETARWLVDAVESRWPHTVAAVVFPGEHGRQVVAPNLPTPLAEPLDAADGVDLPWAATDAASRVDELDDLPADLRAAAARLGFGACAVVHAHRPEPGAAFVLAWFDEAAAARLEWSHWAGEVTGLLGLALDQRDRRRELHERARRDPLTDLPNRIGFTEQATALLADHERAGDLHLLYIDLDGFKPVNDRLGHAVGDRVLEAVARRLSAALPDRLVARIGGDEFVVASRLAGGDAAEALCARILEAITQPVVVADGDSVEHLVLGASIGVAAVRPSAPSGPADLDAAVTAALTAADTSMYEAKRCGPNRWHVAG
jgi:diguanylate cyclase (GGDEF)-like protein